MSGVNNMEIKIENSGIHNFLESEKLKKNNKYWLAIDYGLEGWKIKMFTSLEIIKDEIKEGNTFGNTFKVFKEIEFELNDKD